MIVGDAFKLASHDSNYYRDIFLLWPFLLLSILGIAGVASSQHSEQVTGLKFLGLAVVVVCLAKERLVLLLAATGFCAVRLLWGLIFHPEVRFALAFLVAGIPFVLLARGVRNYRPSYKLPNDLDMLGLIVGVGGLVVTLFLFHFLK
jgi:hypothetical protein